MGRGGGLVSMMVLGRIGGLGGVDGVVKVVLEEGLEMMRLMRLIRIGCGGRGLMLLKSGGTRRSGGRLLMCGIVVKVGRAGLGMLLGRMRRRGMGMKRMRKRMRKMMMMKSEGMMMMCRAGIGT